MTMLVAPADVTRFPFRPGHVRDSIADVIELV